MPPPSATHHLPPSHPAQRTRPKSPNRVLAEAEAQWTFTPAELANTPSIQDGLSPAEEKDIRTKGVNFILQVGILLKLPQLTLSTAATFFQRFLMRSSLKGVRDGVPKLHHYQSAAVALFLATKVEESCRKMKEIVLACCRIAQKNPNLIIDEQSKDFWKWRDCILHSEDVMLEVLCFDLTVESPHRQLFDMLKYYGQQHNKPFRNASWAFVSDSANTMLCLLCSSRTIAAAAFYNACRVTDVQIPDDKMGRPWWEGAQVKIGDVRMALEYMRTHYVEANGANGKNGQGVDGGEGDRSIYAGLSTPLDMTDEHDGTRLRPNGASVSPVQASQNQLLAPGSERRLSNASSIGQKRAHEDEAPAETNGITTNGVHRAGSQRPQESKRIKLEPESNGQAPNGARDSPAAHDLRVTEEKLRVQNGNRQNEADVRETLPVEPTPVVKQDDAGSEEGEVEE
nr:hypothetical protein B0A51_07720 [Rachicladosporium sp. CCFEE 5018]